MFDPLSEREPQLPEGITDRPADVWEGLLAIAELAGGWWPQRAREACVALNADRQSVDTSLGLRLLADLRDVFDTEAQLFTTTLLDGLNGLDDAPWGNLRGKPLDARGLSRRLGRYDVRSTTVRIGATVAKGYRREDVADAWDRYLPPASPNGSVTSVTSVTPEPASEPASVTDVTDVTEPDGEAGTCSTCGGAMKEDGYCPTCDT